MVLHGDICTLRSVESKDVDTILLWENDPTLAPFSSPHEPYSRSDIKQFVRDEQQGFLANKQLRLIIEVEGHSIGAIDLFDYDGTQTEIGILIYDEQYRRRGYASEALRIVMMHAHEWHIKRLKAVVAEENLASRALFERCGFVKTDFSTYICNL